MGKQKGIIRINNFARKNKLEIRKKALDIRNLDTSERCGGRMKTKGRSNATITASKRNEIRVSQGVGI